MSAQPTSAQQTVKRLEAVLLWLLKAAGLGVALFGLLGFGLCVGSSDWGASGVMFSLLALALLAAAMVLGPLYGLVRLVGWWMATNP